MNSEKSGINEGKKFCAIKIEKYSWVFENTLIKVLYSMNIDRFVTYSKFPHFEWTQSQYIHE